MNLTNLKPENVRVAVLSVTKTHEEDSFENGIIGELIERDPPFIGDKTYPSVMHMVRLIVGDDAIKPDDVGTIDGNIYIDVKGGGSRVVENNTKRGHFRVTYDRMETPRGNVPNPETKKAWEKGESKLMLARYDFYFRLEIVGLDETALAEVVGVNNRL